MLLLFSHVLTQAQGSRGEFVDLTGSTGTLITLTLDAVAKNVSSDDESSANDSVAEMICGSVGTFPSNDSGASSGFPEDVLAHLDEEPKLFADEESLCCDEQLELLTIEFDARVAGSKWEAESAEGENKRKADSLVANLEVAPESKRCRTAKSHAETMRSTKDDQFTRLGQATIRMLKRK